MRTMFISGHLDVDVKEFSKYYIPLIHSAMEAGCHFVVGDGDGVDALAQIFLKKMIPEDQHSRVKVFYRGEKPQNYMSTGFVAAGGFVTHEEAAVAMTLCSDEDIAYIHNGRDGSDTGKNILRRFTKDFPYAEWANKKNRNFDFWEFIMNPKQTEDQE